MFDVNPPSWLVDKWQRLLNQLSPRGEAIPQHQDSNWQKWYRAMATVFAALNADIDAVALEWNPLNTLTRLNDWEKVTQGIDDCELVTNTIDERRARIVAKVRMTAGGMDGKTGSAAAIAYLESIAAALGYDVTIIKTATCVLQITINSFDHGVACFPRRYNATYDTDGGLYGDCGYALLSCVLDRVAPARYQLNYIWSF